MELAYKEYIVEKTMKDLVVAAVCEIAI